MFMVVATLFLVMILLGVGFFNKTLALLLSVLALCIMLFALISDRRRSSAFKRREDKLQSLQQKMAEYDKTDIGQQWLQSDSSTWYDYTRARKLTSSFIVIDFVTTGTNPIFDEIVQIAVIRFKNRQETSRAVWTIKTTFPVPEDILDINNINERALAEALLLVEVWPLFLEFISSGTEQDNLVLYDGSLYIQFIIATSKRLGIEGKKYRIIDILKLGKKRMASPKDEEETVKKRLGYDEAKTVMSNCEAISGVYMSLF